MTRSEFIKNLAALGIGLPFIASSLTSCRGDDFFGEGFEVNFSGKVLVIGAGAAGLFAGHILNQHNIDFQILEASSVFGGRVKKIDNFADFPIDLGAEWIHANPSVLAKLINDPDSNAEIETIVYGPETQYQWNGEKLTRLNVGINPYREFKFKNSTWYDLLDQFIVPEIESQILYDKPVNAIDYSGDKVIVTTVNNETYEADKILITVPMAVLKNDFIAFTPELPTDKTEVFNRAIMPEGIKVFMEFSDKFYPDVTMLPAEVEGDIDEKIYYDAAFRKDTDRNILGLFTVGNPAAAYRDMASDTEIINAILAELDQIFDGKASASYIKHITQHWTHEPFIQGSYTYYEGSEETAMETMLIPVDNKIWFAGEATAVDNSATVHGAGESANAQLMGLLKD